jgi:pyruvate dehydrogenase E2 component (dihydrolipoamide acetyltransferase)
MIPAAGSAEDGGSDGESAAAADSSPAGNQETASAETAGSVAASPADSAPASALSAEGAAGISPRARNLAASSGLDGIPAAGSGPGGRIIERDVKAVIEGRAPLTPAAKAVGGIAPQSGSGIGGRVLASDMGSGAASSAGAPSISSSAQEFPGPAEVIEVKGIRKVIAQRMHASLMETAQFTLNSSASAESLLSWRAKYKNSSEEFGLNGISINDLVMFAVAKLLPLYPELNATYQDGKITQYKHVHLGFAVDTPRGLMVPVVKFADQLSLLQLSSEIRRLATACRDGKAAPDELSGGTFTVTNLGSFGIESFTPVVNTPEVAILGVNTIYNSVVEKDGGVGIEKRIGFSLTVDHQIVDGAPGARFLKAYIQMISDLELLAAL